MVAKESLVGKHSMALSQVSYKRPKIGYATVAIKCYNLETILLYFNTLEQNKTNVVVNRPTTG